MRLRHAVPAAFLLSAACHHAPPPAGGPPSPPNAFTVVIRAGTVYDGTGSPGVRADVGIRGDRIAAIGDLSTESARTVVDATGLAIAPGFINMLSWSTD